MNAFYIMNINKQKQDKMWLFNEEKILKKTTHSPKKRTAVTETKTEVKGSEILSRKIGMDSTAAV